ncbi:MAG: alpha-amylase [FCB group bacterium]|nr:alpha-amylase [FCB group bacterium]
MENHEHSSGLPLMEFHISGKCRDKYRFSERFFTSDGKSVLINFKAVRAFTQAFNAGRPPGATVLSSDLNAMGLIHEILHFVFTLYKQQKNPPVLRKALAWLNKRLSTDAVEAVLLKFAQEFPATSVYRKEIKAEDYLQGHTGGVSNREIILEEILMLWLENKSPAFAPFRELFDDTDLRTDTKYLAVIKELRDFFDTQPFFGPDDENLVAMLRSPAIAAPNSLRGQLDYIRDRWGYLLGDYLLRLLRGLDYLAEESRTKGQGPGEIRVLQYDESGDERFSSDRDWMPNVVMIAKNTFVWLDQLSKAYGRPITRLDEIPDEELDRLADYGFNALWLIGLWERSQSSEYIKRLCGNPEAEASAYALKDYSIAQKLGGQEAFENLKNRCWLRGIRMAGDMVPNHTGIDSRWVIEHPDWFISLDHSPFPSYTFNGVNVSSDERVGIYLEDHYYDRSDAAVVFKRRDFLTGDERYIYHGNDGTTMPWNDTAQLNYLNPEVREAVMQTILHVARNFPIIRFDAAMTLTKKHYQRLWFPIPGTGSDIPSRAEYGLTKAEFDALMPKEFWREVVDRVAAEAPDTLLLAEAFWMMESYFVRTLGMHRVYNSAFMNMLKMEENAKYRTSLKNTLEFDPEILKRFVNFLNNPDEETAVRQFGKGDKYFGVTLLMATLPGLPLFGHGQIEAFEEKYGMEYKRAYHDEVPDETHIQRHRREIFPLLKKRYLFSGVENFLLYDFYTAHGTVNENVIAYSNLAHNERTLVLYNNTIESTSGWIKTSVAYNDKSNSDGKPNLRRKSLGQGLRLTNADGYYLIFREHATGLEYIRESAALFNQGLFAELRGYQYQLFMDFREIRDNEYRHYEELNRHLAGKGVPSIDDALMDLYLRPVHAAFDALAGEAFHELYSDFVRGAPADTESLAEFEERWKAFGEEILNFTTGGENDTIAAIGETMRLRLENTLIVRTFRVRHPVPKKRYYTKSENFLNRGFSDYEVAPLVLLLWSVLSEFYDLSETNGRRRSDLNLIEDLRLADRVNRLFTHLGFNDGAAAKGIQLLSLLCKYQNLLFNPDSELIGRFFSDAKARTFLNVNRYNDILWFGKEAFEELVWSLFAVSVIIITAIEGRKESRVAAEIVRTFRTAEKYLSASMRSGYQFEQLQKLLLEKRATGGED